MFYITHYLEYVSKWKSKGLSNESIKAISTSNNSFNRTLSYYGTKIRVKLTGGIYYFLNNKTTKNFIHS